MTEGFGLDHLPYGVVSTRDGRRFAATRLGNDVLNLAALPRHGALFEQPSLDALLAAGPLTWRAMRAELVEVLNGAGLEPHPVQRTRNLLPFRVADYVDFYASEHHARKVGQIFRPGADALPPNWKHLPIGYHGRAGTVIVSGTSVRRPSGQYRDAAGEVAFGPSQKLDIEAEVAFVVGAGSERGSAIALADLTDHVLGLCLLNDWSARDIQAWEYVPLGPFLGKSFATSVAGWITPLDAVDAAWVAPPPRDQPLLPYLDDAGVRGGLDLELEVRLNGEVIARPPMAAMYWTPAQMLAHLTVNGASTQPGDLFASGTVSGPEANQRGCLLELTCNGAQPLTLADGSTRAFLLDGDEVVITATAPTVGGDRLRLGEVRGIIAPATRQPYPGSNRSSFDPR
jgi:fumarylacetoacetase